MRLGQSRCIRHARYVHGRHAFYLAHFEWLGSFPLDSGAPGSASSLAPVAVL